MKKYLDKIGKNSKKASIKSVTTSKKNKVLIDFANLIKKNRTKIIYQNKKDQKYAIKKGIKNNMIERLILNSTRLKQIEKSVVKIANLKDPVDKTLLMWKRPNGLVFSKISITSKEGMICTHNLSVMYICRGEIEP